jgi:PAS domain S-box-containing protein
MKKKSSKNSRSAGASSARGRRIAPGAERRGAGRAPSAPAERKTSRSGPRGSAASPQQAAAKRGAAAGAETSPAKGAARSGKRPAVRLRRPVSAAAGLPAEWKLLECQSSFRSLIEISPDAIFIHQAWKYLSINPAGVRLFGAADAGEIVGRALLDYVHPDYREFIRDRIEMSYHLKRATSLRELRILRVDGSSVPVEAISSPVTVKGKPATLVILRDISLRSQREEALRESERQLRTIFNSPGILLGIVEDQGNDILIIAANPELSAAYGVKPGDLNGRFAREFGVPGEVIEEQRRHYDAARQRGATETWEYHRTWGGRQQWALNTVSYIGRGPEGHHRYTFLAQDITERKRAEDILREVGGLSEALNRISAVIHATLNPDQVIQSAVAEGCRALGCETGAVFLKNVDRWTVKAVHGLPAEIVGTAMNDDEERHAVLAVSTKRPVAVNDALNDERVSHELLRRHNIRSVLVVPLFVQHEPAGVIFFNHHSRPTAFTEAQIDFADKLAFSVSLALENSRLFEERARIEMVLRQSESEFRGIFELSAAGMAEADPATGRFLKVNRKFCDITGYTEKELRARTFRDITHAEDRTVDAVRWESVVRGEADSWFSEKRYVRRDGGIVHVSVNGTCLRDLRGQPFRTIAVIQDISGHKQAEGILKARLRLLEFSRTHTLEELLVATLDEAEAVTGSRIGFLHFLEADQQTLSLQAWSTRTTREMCRAEGRGRHYNVSEAGVWVDAIRQRRPVIHNDYPSLSHRKGLPPNHAPVIREMAVPVFRGDRVMAILGVGNKPHDYADADVEAVSLLADLAWDITERMRSEEALQRSHDELEQRVQQRTRELQASFARISLVLESITDGFFAVDRDLRLTYVNSVVMRLWGRDRKDLIGRTLWDVAPEARGTVFEEQYRKALAERTPVFFEALSPFSHAWMEVRAYPSEAGLYVFAQDITGRRRAEEQRHRLEAAISSVGEMVVITDRRGTILYVNPAFENITGFPSAEALGQTMHLLDSGKHDDAFYRDLREKLHRDGTWQGRFMSRKKDGTVFFEDCTLSAVIDAAGAIVNYVSVRRDVTERLRFESIAESVDTMNNIGYVFSGVRHEVGNPINTAKMILTVLQQKLGQATNEAIADYVARALDEIGRVERLLWNLKNFNLYERLEPETVMTADYLDSFLRLVTEDLTKKGISLSRRVGPGAEQLRADPRALQQVLLNLVTNAADAVAGRSDPRIDIEVLAGRGTAQIRITDNGRGMSEEEQRNLFRPFYTTKQGGTGLGLVIVKKMLAQMGGTISIISRRDAGTQVEISLTGSGDGVPA